MPHETALSRYAPIILSIVRIMVALIFLAHGTGKIFGFPAAEVAAAGPAMFARAWFAGWIEIGGGTLMVLGLYTRPVAFILSGEMAFAYFLSHAPRNFYPLLNNGDAPVLYCFIFLYFAAAGAGPISLDAKMRNQP